MNAKLHARATELFLVAVGLPIEQRASFVDQACADDGALRAAVLELLAHDEAGDDFLAGTAHDATDFGGTTDASSTDASTDDTDTGGAPSGVGSAERRAREVSPLTRLLPEEDDVGDLASLGGYTVERRIGEGGMGLVYQARRPGSAQPVAIKVLRPELATTAFVQRLEAEAWALSQLEHPGIARLLDSGTWPTADGLRPYLVMELVRGRPITAWARECGADQTARLEVLARLCDAVHHAHLRGVIHRDLKPANVLVTEEGRPKILDFGIARLADRPVGLHTVATDLGRFVGTLAYMSPEQVRFGPHEADMRADVYALGVMAYELLGGRLPVDVNTLSVAQAVHAITGSTPTPLGRVRKELRGDVEMIVAKAMHPDRARRYGTAAAMADDIRRQLSGQPVSARPPTAWELVKRAVRTHPWAVGACTVVVVALFTGLALQQASNRRLAADKLWMTDLIGGIMGFLTAQVPATDPQGPSLRELLLHADSYMQSDLAHRPDIEGALRVVLGRTLSKRGDSLDEEVARAHLERGIEQLTASFGPHDARTVEGWIQLADLIISSGAGDEAEIVQVIADLEHAAGDGGSPETRVRVGQLRGEALAARGLVIQAEELLQETLAAARVQPGVEHEAAQSVMAALVRLSPREEAVWLAEELVAVRERVLGAEHTQTLWARSLLGRTHRRRAQSLRSNQPDLAEAHFDQAEEIMRGVLAARQARLGERHLAVWNDQIVLGWLLNARGEHMQSLDIFEHVAMEFEATFGPQAQRTLQSLTSLAEVARRKGDLERAERTFRHVLEILPGSELDTPLHHGVQRIGLGQVLTQQGRFDEAEVLLLRAARDWAGFVNEPEALVKLHGSLRKLYDDWGRKADAARHSAEVTQLRPLLMN